MPLNRRNLRPGESPFTFRNQDSARAREELIQKSTSRAKEMQDFLNKRQKSVRRASE
jgi:hypothetical protein